MTAATAKKKSNSSQRPSAALIELHDLSVAFGRQPVLRDINLSIPRGQTLAVIGESGCGKTVLLKTIIGLLHPTAGHVVFDGQRIDELDDKELTAPARPLRLRVSERGLVRQHDDRRERRVSAARESPHDGRTKREPIVDEAPRPKSACRTSVLPKRPAQLSGGMRKRVGLARALVMNPEVLLYDEPTTGLDPIMSDVINELILRTREQQPVTSIVVTHDMKTAQKVADRIVMLYPLARLDPTSRKSSSTARRKKFMKSKDKRVAQFVRGEAGERLMEMQEQAGVSS